MGLVGNLEKGNFRLSGPSKNCAKKARFEGFFEAAGILTILVEFLHYHPLVCLAPAVNPQEEKNSDLKVLP